MSAIGEWNTAQESVNIAKILREADDNELLSDLLGEVLAWYVHYRRKGFSFDRALGLARLEYDV